MALAGITWDMHMLPSTGAVEECAVHVLCEPALPHLLPSSTSLWGCPSSHQDPGEIRVFPLRAVLKMWVLEYFLFEYNLLLEIIFYVNKY